MNSITLENLPNTTKMFSGVELFDLFTRIRNRAMILYVALGLLGVISLQLFLATCLLNISMI